MTVLDKDASRPTTKTLDKRTGEYVLRGPTTLSVKCKTYGVKTIDCDIERERIPLADESVATIVFTEVIEHLRVGLLNALRELHCILSPSGRLIVTTLNLLSLKNRVSFMFGQCNYDTLQMPYESLAAEERIGHGGHFRVFSMPEVIDLLQKTGFFIVYKGFHQIDPANSQVRRLSPYTIRMALRNCVTTTIKSLRNTMFLVAARD